MRTVMSHGEGVVTATIASTIREAARKDWT
jgi:hypothetical protein